MLPAFPILDRNQRATWVILFVLILTALLARLIPGPRTIDDSYITYRYARNILAGNGFVYNPGERVLGTTTPLYTILLVGLGALSGGVAAPFPEIAWLVNALADALTCLLLFRIGRKLKFPLAGFGAAMLWAVAPYSVTFAIGGLETSLYVLLLTATVSAYLAERYSLAALLGALAVITRPDALILIGPLALDRLWMVFGQREGRTVRQSAASIVGEVMIFSLPLLIWMLFAAFYFGNPLPHSIAAKSIAYRLPGNAAFIRLLQHYATPFMGHLTFGVPWIGVGMFLYPFLYLVGARAAFRSNPRSWPYLVYPWAYFAVFAIGTPLIFRWYLTPPLPAYILTILIGLESMLTQFLQRVEINASFKRAIPIALVVILPLALMLRDWRLHPDHGLSRPAPEMAWYQLELQYRQAAAILTADYDEASADSHESLPHDLPLLAAGDVGVLGYDTGFRILDTVGLNSPITLDYYPLDESLYITNYAVPPDLILDTQPDYLVMMEVYGRLGLLKDARFKERYQLLEKIPSDIYGSDGMLIYKRLK